MSCSSNSRSAGSSCLVYEDVKSIEACLLIADLAVWDESRVDVVEGVPKNETSAGDSEIWSCIVQLAVELAAKVSFEFCMLLLGDLCGTMTTDSCASISLHRLPSNIL